MKPLVLLCGGFVLSLLALPAHADPAAFTPPAAVETKIRALEDEEHNAVLAGDVPTLERLWAVNVIINNPQSGITPSRDALLQRVREGKIRYTAFERTIEALRGDEDLVIVMGAEKVVPAGPGPGAGQPVLRRFTDLWKRRDGTWTLIARHANVVPPTNP